MITRGLTDNNPEVPAILINSFFIVFFLIVGMVLMNVGNSSRRLPLCC